MESEEPDVGPAIVFDKETGKVWTKEIKIGPHHTLLLTGQDEPDEDLPVEDIAGWLFVPDVWPSWWKRMFVRLVLGWKWLKRPKPPKRGQIDFAKATPGIVWEGDVEALFQRKEKNSEESR